MIPAKKTTHKSLTRHRPTANLSARTFCSYIVALVFAIAFSAVASSLSQTGRLVNIDLSQKGISESYLMFSKTEAGRGYLVARRDSTLRRSRRTVRGESWELSSFSNGHSARGSAEKGEGPVHWLLRSDAQRTVFLVPVSCVKARDYVFAYNFVAREYEDLELPTAKWTQLFVNRIYQGLYLRLDLPRDLRKKDGGSGVLREICSVRDSEMTVVDTAFHAETRVYADCVANGVFPALKTAPPVLQWLDAQSPTKERILLLGSAEPFEVSLLPLPVSLDALFELVYGKTPTTITDERYVRWQVHGMDAASTDVFDADVQKRFNEDYEAHKSAFEAALKVHQAVRADVTLAAGIVQHGKRRVGVLAE